MKKMKEEINPIGMAAAFLCALSMMLILGYKYMPVVLLDGKISEGKYLVEGGRYGIYQVSPIYWWSSMIIQASATILIIILFIQQIAKKRKASDHHHEDAQK
ncbi:MAG: hypothetical protein JJU29_24035 [Verrucomicrobia bacterium]|nr:hypothetical protein [Verrucomicrobiota bacterium]